MFTPRNQRRMSWTASAVAALTFALLVSSAAAQQWTTNGANINNTNAGNVGVGTTSPQDKLDVNGNIRVGLNGSLNSQNSVNIRDILNGRAVMRFVPIGTLTTNPTNFEFYGTDFLADATNYERLLIRSKGTADVAYKIATDSGGTGQIRPVQITTGANNGIFIDATGKVGVGTTTPSQALDVNGSINVSVNINAKYQDVAEWVAADEPIAPGTIVVLDPNHANRVIPSSNAYDTTVAGIISSKPGITLGEPSASKVLVATTGRVLAKVDATRGRIRIGDLLVTSDKPGIAMRSEPLDLGGRKVHQPGTLIGKALEPLDGGVGEILVLVSLQ